MALLHTDHAVELTRAQRTLAALDAAIDAFVVRLNRAGMTQESALRLATVLRRMTYYASVAELLPAVSAASQELPVPTSPVGAAVLTNVGLLRQAVGDFLQQLDPQDGSSLPPGHRHSRGRLGSSLSAGQDGVAQSGSAGHAEAR